MMNLDSFLKVMVDMDASDLFFSVGAPVNAKVEGLLKPLTESRRHTGNVKTMAYSIMSADKIQECESELESEPGLCSKRGWPFSCQCFQAARRGQHGDSPYQDGYPDNR